MTQGSWHSDASFLQFVRYQSPPMSNPSFDHPNLNSPYECPRRHWEPASDGQPTQRIIENRRRAEFITPMPKPKERKGSAKQVETLAKLIGQDTLENFARSVAALHKPITFKWAAKFGLAEAPPSGNLGSGPNAPSQTPLYATIPAAEVSAVVQEDSKPKKKLICTKCSDPVALNVARFCWFNKAKFGGNVYCMECQKTVQGTSNSPFHM